jgi:hypothetical protein
MSPKEEEFILNMVFTLEERTLIINGIYSPDIILSMQCSVATQRLEVSGIGKLAWKFEARDK